MRRLATALATAVAVAGAGCGDDASGPLDEALGYLPEKAPFVVAVETDLEGDRYRKVDRLLGKFAFGDSVKEAVRERIEEAGLDFERDLKPLLGNPFVVGATDARSFLADQPSQFVGAIQAKDQGELKDALEKEGAREAGEAGGGTLYQDDDGDFFAVKDDVLVVGDSRRTVEEALEQRESDDRLTEDRFEEALEGLPEQALARVYGDVEALIASDPDARTARRIGWVAALRTFGAAAGATEEEVAIDFDLKTEAGNLEPQEVPIATGGEAPPVLTREGEVSVGIRDPAQLVDFGLAAADAVEPVAVAAGRRRIEQRLGIDVARDLTAQLGGPAALNVSLDGEFGLRSEVRDARAFEETLDKVARRLPAAVADLGGGPIRVSSRGGDGLYRLVARTGARVFFGLVDGVFVLGDDRKLARQLARSRARPAPDADGAVAIRADGEEIASRLLRGRLQGLAALAGQLVTDPLGELTGSVRGETSGLRGRVRLAID